MRLLASMGLVAALALGAGIGACGGEAPAPIAGAGAEALPEPRDPRTEQARAHLLSGRTAEARAILEAVVAERPGLGEPELLLGLTWHEEKSYARARPHLERAVAAGPRFPKHASTHYFLGWCLYYLGEPAAARASFERHLALDPEEGDTRFALGLIALDSGALDEAAGRFREAIALHERAIQAGRRALVPELAKCHARLADVHAQAQRWAEARSELEACVRLHPAHYEAWYKLATAQRRLGDERAAEESLRRSEEWRERAGGGANPR